ncbi:MAG: flagellar basal body L-ring protein FlgH, partial [Planctomycetes bacterium]|nr:flagellar basal body L-ring protein FlgH [Planctomycetota bacterium]
MIQPTDFSSGKPAIKAEAKRTFDGSGTASGTHTLAARITGMIIDVKPNGNLTIEASKNITTEEETYTLTMTGICRSEDVTADNSIISSQIAELEIHKESTGAIKDATKRGAFHRLLDWINIF